MFRGVKPLPYKPILRLEEVESVQYGFTCSFRSIRERERWIGHYKFRIILETYNQATSFVPTSKPNGESSCRETSIYFCAKRLKKNQSADDYKKTKKKRD